VGLTEIIVIAIVVGIFAVLFLRQRR